MLVKYVFIDGIPQTFVFFRFVDIIDITVHDRFWNVGQANFILNTVSDWLNDKELTNGSFRYKFKREPITERA